MRIYILSIDDRLFKILLRDEILPTYLHLLTIYPKINHDYKLTAYSAGSSGLTGKTAINLP